jgi:hypothetical protein
MTIRVEDIRKAERLPKWVLLLKASARAEDRVLIVYKKLMKPSTPCVISKASSHVSDPLAYSEC